MYLYAFSDVHKQHYVLEIVFKVQQNAYNLRN